MTDEAEEFKSRMKDEIEQLKNSLVDFYFSTETKAAL